eukprot:COSAG02_NODE_1225_length_13785_cov_12.911588_7_plen_371_part_00
MADVLAEMATSAVSNPLGEQPAEVKDSGDKMPTPDFFASLRPLLMDARGDSRLIVRLSPWIALVGSLAMPGAALLMEDNALVETTIQRIRFGIMGPVFCGAPLYLPLLCAAIRAETGALARLIGDEEDRDSKLLTEQQVRNLKCWRVLLAIPAVVIVLFGLTSPGPFIVRITLAALGFLDPDPEWGPEWETMIPLIPAFPSVLFSLIVGYPCAICWYFSMRVAVHLAQDEVVVVARSATREALRDETVWTSTVAQPAMNLATRTMKNLSLGWGTGTGITALICAIASLGNFMGVVHEIATNGDNTEGIVRKTVGCIGAAVAPFVIATDTANVSTSCDRLMRAINDLRLEWPSSDDAYGVHRRIFPLQCTL